MFTGIMASKYDDANKANIDGNASKPHMLQNSIVEKTQLNVFNSYYLSDIIENHSKCAWLCNIYVIIFRILIMQIFFVL